MEARPRERRRTDHEQGAAAPCFIRAPASTAAYAAHSCTHASASGRAGEKEHRVEPLQER